MVPSGNSSSETQWSISVPTDYRREKPGYTIENQLHLYMSSESLMATNIFLEDVGEFQKLGPTYGRRVVKKIHWRQSKLAVLLANVEKLRSCAPPRIYRN
jgi:hypothetical protein